MKNTMLENIALKIATEAHKNQTRDEINIPYINHPVSVVNILKKYFPDDSDLIAAAYCHDVLEDCPQVAEQYLLIQIGSNAFGLVEECTNPSKEYPGLPREARKSMDREHIANGSIRAKYLKLADRTCNLQDTYGTQSKEWARTYIKESMLLYSVLAGTHYELELLYMDALVKAAKSIE